MKQLEYYGCVKCQKFHYKPQPIYKDHIFFQDKHSIRTIPMKIYLQLHSK